ncbi:MAG: DUF3579 domain-containing protein [Rubrivivax sp.]|nr:MAG: DUF3579 domain-containing protein [Rubrivivax sp.]
METVLSDPVSSALASCRDHPSDTAPSHHGASSPPTAVSRQPVNASIAQPVESSIVPDLPEAAPASPAGPTTTSPASGKPREVFIHGLTSDGRAFRPSDWAERLAGAMSCFRPGGVKSGIGAHLGYSPYCVPTSLGDVRCVVVNEALRKVEPMAWDFVMNFARDNDLQVFDACLLPDVPVPPRKKR